MTTQEIITEAAIARTEMDIIARLLQDRPVFHSGGKRRWDSLPSTLRAIQEAVSDGDSTLETGCGASTVVFAAQGAYHTAISPDLEEHDRVKAYCKQVGIDSSRLTFIDGFSDLALPELCKARVLDAAFIDGAHSFPFPAVDWHYITRALKIGGNLVIDDIPIPAVACVFHYMQSDPSWRLDSILDDRAASLTLVTEPAPEDWTLQPFNRRPDYSFAPLPARARLRATFEAGQIRSRLGDRFPLLRRGWQRLSARTDDLG
jgi:hypothetical protein